MTILAESAAKKIEGLIRERFGEPIAKVTPTVGISDDRSGKVATKGEGHDLTEDDIDEVAPPGMEDTVKKLKKDKNVDNPWAVAWSIHNKKKK